AVLRAVVALLAGIDDAVAARRDALALVVAVTRRRRITLLAAGEVEDSVAAEQPRLDLARRRTTVAVVGVAVVALLGAARRAVSASGLHPTARAAAITIGRVAVVAFLAGLDTAIAADGARRWQLDLDELAASHLVGAGPLVRGAGPRI